MSFFYHPCCTGGSVAPVMCCVSFYFQQELKDLSSSKADAAAGLAEANGKIHVGC